MNSFRDVMPSFFLFSFVNLRSFSWKGRHSSLSGFAVGPKPKIYGFFQGTTTNKGTQVLTLDVVYYIWVDMGTKVLEDK